MVTSMITFRVSILKPQGGGYLQHFKVKDLQALFLSKRFLSFIFAKHYRESILIEVVSD